MNGAGEFEFADGTLYTGTFVNNEMDGEGVYQWTDGCSFTGKFKNGMRYGVGKFSNFDGKGSVACGVWKDRLMLSGWVYDGERLQEDVHNM